MTDSENLQRRLLMALIGALAGLACYVLVDVVEEFLTGHARFWLTTATAGFFVPLLALIGPLEPRRAGLAAAVIGVVSSSLVAWAALRYAQVEDFMAAAHGLMAYGALVLLPLPFAIAQADGPGGWRDYAVLFDQAWGLVVRGAAALIFVGLVWGVVFLSDAVLQIVGLTLIEDLLEIDAVPYVLTGLTLGLSAAVVYELSAYVSPQLILRLLLLLLPVVLAVTALFIAALPLRGLGGLFGSLSPAATLMAMAIAAITLISTAVERDADRELGTGAMRAMTQALALLLPVLAGLAAYAVWLRVDQYGWTPPRLVAWLSALVLTAYAMAYALEVLRRGDWMARLRRDNTALALVVAGLSALWLTPALDASRLSTNSQLARFEAGQSTVDQLPIWMMAEDWGLAGQDGLTRLEAMTAHPEYDEIAARIAAARSGHSRYSYVDGGGGGAQLAAALLRDMPVQPQGATLDRALLSRVSAEVLRAWSDGCAVGLPDGAPGCVALRLPGGGPGGSTVWIVLAAIPGGAAAYALPDTPGDAPVWPHNPADLASGGLLRADRAMIAAIQAGDYRIGPTTGQSLFVGDAEVFPNNSTY